MQVPSDTILPRALYLTTQPSSFTFDCVLFLRRLDPGEQETDAAVRTVTSSLEEKSGGRFLLLWTGDFHDASCGRRYVRHEMSL